MTLQVTGARAAEPRGGFLARTSPILFALPLLYYILTFAPADTPALCTQAATDQVPRTAAIHSLLIRPLQAKEYWEQLGLDPESTVTIGFGRTFNSDVVYREASFSGIDIGWRNETGSYSTRALVCARDESSCSCSERLSAGGAMARIASPGAQLTSRD